MNSQRSWLYRNLANIITLTRVPLSLLIIFFSKNLFLVIVLVLLIALTDFVDGKLAKKMGIESKKGEILDPITDKVFFVIMFFVLIGMPFPFWMKVIMTATAIVELGLLYYWILGVAKGLNASTTKIKGKRYGPGQIKMFLVCTAMILGLLELFYQLNLKVIDYALCILWSASFFYATRSLMARRKSYVAQCAANGSVRI